MGIAFAHSTTTFSMVPTQESVQSAFPLHGFEALKEEACAAGRVRKDRRRGGNSMMKLGLELSRNTSVSTL